MVDWLVPPLRGAWPALSPTATVAPAPVMVGVWWWPLVWSVHTMVLECWPTLRTPPATLRSLAIAMVIELGPSFDLVRSASW